MDYLDVIWLSESLVSQWVSPVPLGFSFFVSCGTSSTHRFPRGCRSWQLVTLFMSYSCSASLRERAGAQKQTEQSANECLKIVLIYLNNQFDLIMSPVYNWKMIFLKLLQISIFVIATVIFLQLISFCWSLRGWDTIWS